MKKLLYLLMVLPLLLVACDDKEPTPQPKPEKASLTLTSDEVVDFEAEGGDDRAKMGGSKDRPKADINPVFHDFGSARKGSRLRVEVTIRNSGSAPLVVRSVVPRSGTTIGLSGDEVIAHSESRVVELTYTIPIEGYDTVYGGAMIVVNDPLRPVRELRVAANVN
jgi:hypothetical protein